MTNLQSYLSDFVPITPSFESVVTGRLVRLTHPEDRQGTYVKVALTKCGNNLAADSWCLQARGHSGPCWMCSKSLFMEADGAWARLVTDS